MQKKSRLYTPWVQTLLSFSCLLFTNQVFSAEVTQTQSAAYQAQRKVDLTKLAATKMQKKTIYDGDKEIDMITVSGRPPVVFRAQAVDAVEAAATSTTAVILTNVPAFNWTYGCSATSAGMMMGYYDNHGYTNMYSGPTNGGVCPLNNETYWGIPTWTSYNTYGECPLVATHMGYDDLATYGHVDDFWVSVNSSASDPYTNSRTAHTWADCTADYMGTNQSAYGNVDGGTRFYLNPDGNPLYNYTACETEGYRDGCHGLRQFIESRGYSVSDNFSQYIYGYNGNTLGFTFANFQTEINHGRPVLIQLTGHTVLGFGYDTNSSTIYIHDTWDHSDHTMTWGGTYSSSSLTHYAVTVIRLESIALTVSDISPSTCINAGTFDVTISGAYFESGASVSLTKSGQTDIVATNVVVNSTSSISCTFDLTNVATGSWNIIVTNPDSKSSTLFNSFTIDQAVYYVSTTGSDSNNGTSWSSAKSTVAAGLTAASSGRQVWVAAGTYSERITLKSGVALYGGFAGTETLLSQRDPAANVTILDGSQGGSVVTTPFGATSATIINGFTIQNGKAASGGGINITSGSPTVSNNVISGNTATNSGGGINITSSSPTVSNNIISGNIATNNGGGINITSSSPTVSNNIISGNSASTGGGIYCFRSTASIFNNTICGNSGTTGGGIYISNCSPIIANNIIAYNGTGIYQSSTGTVPLYTNCVYNTTNYTHLSAGSTDIQSNPLFADQANGDYHLTSTSPCRNAGNNSYAQSTWVDMDGESRIYNDQVDIGADEWSWIDGDANCDGVVDVKDLSLLAAGYNTASGATWSMGDFTGNGAVGVEDLSLLAANYGSGSRSELSWSDDYAEAFSTTSAAAEETSSTTESAESVTSDDSDESVSSSTCSSLGLPLIAGLLIAGLTLIKLDN
jgi:parallel beta-helix repeat protein